MNVNINTKNFESSNVISESKFKGHEAKQPTIKYFKHEQDILSLIDMRMNPDNPLTEKTIPFKYSNSSGIKEAEALKIGSILKNLKFAGNASISKEVEEENRLYFEYKIEFPQDK